MQVAPAVDGASVTMRDGAVEIATASWSALEREAVPPIQYDEVAARVGPFAGVVDHPFPTCFVCGPDRPEHDGLRLFPGALGPGRTACTWEPDQSVVDDHGAVGPAVVWAALDCPGGWSSDLAGRRLVLGTITAEVLRAPEIGERCVVVGRLDASGERRSSASTALYGTGSELLARAEAIWVRVDPVVFNQLSSGRGGARRTA
jgi:hypothetical protein